MACCWHWLLPAHLPKLLFLLSVCCVQSRQLSMMIACKLINPQYMLADAHCNWCLPWACAAYGAGGATPKDACTICPAGTFATGGNTQPCRPCRCVSRGLSCTPAFVDFVRQASLASYRHKLLVMLQAAHTLCTLLLICSFSASALLASPQHNTTQVWLHQPCRFLDRG